MALKDRQIHTKEKVQKQDLRILLRLSPFIKPYKKIAIIGYGAIAQYVFNTLKKNDILISSLICRKGREKQAKSCLNKKINRINIFN